MLDKLLARKFHGLKHLVGNTPLLQIEFLYKGETRLIYAKAENFNLTGSIKDRMALYIMKKAYEKGTIKPGDAIIEATSGNTGISFSAIGRTLGHQVIIYMPNWMSRERMELIGSLGAKINLVSKEEGGFLGSIEKAEEYAKSNANTFLPRQFSNDDNITAHYESTGPEIWWQMRFRNLTPDAFIAGVGTGGTIMGVGKFLKEMNSGIKIHPLEPANSPTLTTGHKIGKHRIQGISDEFIPPIVNLGSLDEIVSVEDGDAIIMAQKLAGQLGIGVGISSGANFIGALKMQNKLGGNANVVTVFSDDNKKYLSTDLLRPEEEKEGYLSPDVELIGLSAYKRVCNTCCDPVSCLEGGYDCEVKMQLPQCPRRIANIESAN
ncbi:MAG: cysteine synthase family protein [Ignavibacteria bacterium]|nr:cysteine synthase family protein [Ignavibacteria bacterium]